MTKSHDQLQNPQSAFEPGQSSLRSIEDWYSNLPPEIDINDIPLETHIDAISSSILQLVSQPEIPDNINDRVRSAIRLTTSGSESLTAKIANEGKRGFVFLDLITELPERDQTPPPAMVQKLLDFGVRTAHAIRENQMQPAEDRLAANNKLANLRIASLIHMNKHFPQNVTDFSGNYIGIVRQEANWLSSLGRNGKGLQAGKFFEAFIGNLGKYEVWRSESEDSVYARHATQREDIPSKKSNSNNGDSLAHDVVIKGSARKYRLQCKWGGGADESRAKYDPSLITCITENNDDGEMANNRKIADACHLIATSSHAASEDACNALISRYKLDRLVKNATATVPQSLGSGALALSA